MMEIIMETVEKSALEMNEIGQSCDEDCRKL